MLRSDFCDYSNAYIVIKGKITVDRDNDDKTRNKKLIFKNNSPFRSCLSKINNTFIENAGDLDIAMPIYNLLQYLLEYSDNYSMTSESLWNYYRDKVKDNANENQAANNGINNDKTITSKPFEYKKKSKGSIPNDNNTLNAEVVVPLRYLSNFWRFLDLPLINCEIQLDFLWSKECIISEISITPRVVGDSNDNPPVPAVTAK